jgi:radical SAM superfamily enzyme YgiQ (UPF0313 family)
MFNGTKVAIINPLANIYKSHRKFGKLLSLLKTFMGINLFVSPTTLVLATQLRRMGCEVRIYDDVIEEIDANKVKEPIVLVSIMSTTAKRGYEIAGLFPDRKVIIGGVHASMLPEEASKHADHVVVGESESVLQDLIAGRIKKKIVRAKQLSDLDALPPIDYSFIQKLPDNLPLQTSRGCPFDCNFCCVSKVFGRSYRYRSPEVVIDELKHYRDTYGKIKRIDLRLDANFTNNRERAKEIMRGMLQEGIIPKVVAAHTRLDSYKDKELLSLMSQLNFTAYVGIESLNQETLNDYSKRQRISDTGEAIRGFHDQNIKVHGYFIFGADQDDPDTLKQYEEFAHESDLDTYTVTVLTPHPGTEMYNQLAAQNRIFTRDWDLYDGLHFTYEPARRSASEMQKAFNDFYLRVFSLKHCLNPKLLFNMDVLKYRAFIGILTRMFKKDMSVFTDMLERREASA